MRCFSDVFKVTCLFLVTLPGMALDVTQPRVLTISNGDKMKVAIVSIDDRYVTCRRVSDDQQFTLRPSLFSQKDQAFFKEWVKAKQSSDVQATQRPEKWDERLVPGNTFNVPFKNLENTLSGTKAHARVRIPDAYTYTSEYPMLVWLNPGNGGTVLQKELAPEKEFILVSLPYPNSTGRPRVAMENGTVDKIGHYHKVMMKEVMELIPNIDKRLIICAGFSSGAHITASGASRGWRWFDDTFNCLIFIEGACTDPTSLDGFTGKYVYSAYGANSPFNGSPLFNQKVKQNKPKLFTERIMPGVAHAFPENEVEVARRWLLEQVIPRAIK